MKSIVILLALLTVACSIRPGSLQKLQQAGWDVESGNALVRSVAPDSVTVQYLGCGGIYLIHNGHGILIDPFFSHQPAGRIGRSVILSSRNKKTFRSDREMLERGIHLMNKTHPLKNIVAVLNTHAHYDHLMDIPAIYQQLAQKPPLLLGESAFNTCYNVIDTGRVVKLERYLTTRERVREPWLLTIGKAKIRVHPILADHNPHIRNISFFQGANTRPVTSFSDPYAKTSANLWLEGQTFSFLIDFLDDSDTVSFRAFIQSSSCNPPAGIPPEVLLDRPIDVAFLGVASWRYSPDYPCSWLETLRPRQVVWIHWEDFFRPYDREPKTLRGSDVPDFFRQTCVRNYKNASKIVHPGTTIRFVR